MDISERKRLEEAISALSRRLISAHEEERARLARELHDDINQRLALVTVHLHMIKESLPPSKTQVAQDTIESLGHLLSQIHGRVFKLLAGEQSRHEVALKGFFRAHPSPGK